MADGRSLPTPGVRAARTLQTRAGIVEACRRLIRSGGNVNMPAVAHAAGVSEATAYRHFADLVTLINQSLTELWPSPAEALAPVADSVDAADRVGYACEFLLRQSNQYLGAVRAVIAATVTRPTVVPTRPGFRFGLIDQALDPIFPTIAGNAADRLHQLKLDLAAVVSVEAFLSLTDLCGLSVEDAMGSLVRTARTITDVAMRNIEALGGNS